MSTAEQIGDANEAGVSLLASRELLQLIRLTSDLQPDNPSPERFIAVTRARCIARYRMRTIPGKPEELETHASFPAVPGTGIMHRVISIAYSGGELRIRKHGGPRNRDWIEVRDFRLRDGWLGEVYDFLDSFLGYVATSRTDRPTPATAFPRPRPIRDNPQA